MTSSKKQSSKHQDDVTAEQEEHQFSKKEIGKKKKSSSTKKSSTTSKKKSTTAKAKKSTPKKKATDTKDAEHANMQEQLMEIYENADGSMPDMSTFAARPRGKMFRSIVVLLFTICFLAAVSWYGYRTFQPQSQFSEDDVILSISGDEQIAVGQEVHYRVRYRNAQQVPLANTTMSVRYPKGFVFERASIDPTNESQDEWELGALDTGDSGYIDIFGKLYGDVSQEQSFRVFLRYTPSNFSAEFQKVATLNTTIGDTSVSLTAKGPETVGRGVTETYQVLVSKQELTDITTDYVAVVFDGGTDFTFVGSDKDPDTFGQMVWSIDTVALEDFSLDIKGSFAAISDISEQALTASLVGWNEGQRMSEGYTYATGEHTVAIVDTDIIMNVVVNGGRGEFAVQPGETLNATVSVENKGSEPLGDVRVRLMFDAPSVNKRSILHWSAVENPYDGDIVGEQLSSDIRRGEVTWTSSEIPELKNLKPGEQQLVDISLPVKSRAVADISAYPNKFITITADVQYTANDTKDIVTGNTIVLTLNSDTTLEVQDSISMNSAGKEVHTLTWLIENSLHGLENIKLVADVFGDVTVDPDTIVVPAGKAEYDTGRQRMTWEVETMPTSIDVLAMQFPIILNSKNPSQTQLMGRITMTATDTVTGQEIVLLSDQVLVGDEE